MEWSFSLMMHTQPLLVMHARRARGGAAVAVQAQVTVQPVMRRVLQALAQRLEGPPQAQRRVLKAGSMASLLSME